MKVLSLFDRISCGMVALGNIHDDNPELLEVER